MDRKQFLKTTLLGLAGATTGGAILAAKQKASKQSSIGKTHMAEQPSLTENMVLHRANTRGHANHGWLNSYHTFSFANYHDPNRMQFGALRVLNDDTVAGGRGFGTHAHDNMEIISIPLAGDLQHKDSMGNTAIIRQGDVQVMSAGTGIRHSEYNAHPDKEVKFLQIWVFPNRENVTPRYDQISLTPANLHNQLYQVLSPNPDDQGVWIHQRAWFHLGEWEKGFETTYRVKHSQNGVYAFVIEGDVTLNGQALHRRDGLGIWNTTELQLKADQSATILLMDVPMA